MTIIIEFVIFILALAVLVESADFFVDAAAKLAQYFGVSQFIIGLTIVSIGTSLPELSTAIIAALKNNTGLIVGNIVGSNIANIGLILGISSTMVVLEIKKDVFKRDGLFLLFITTLFFIFSLNRTIGGFEGVIFMFLFIIYFLFMIIFKPAYGIIPYGQLFGNLRRIILPKSYIDWTSSKDEIADYIKRMREESYKKRKTCMLVNEKDLVFSHIMRQVLLIIFSGVAIYYGAVYLVESGAGIATYFEMPQEIVGIVMIAIGTSLPELMVSIAALRRGLNNILIGNIIGSNIANILLIGGVAAIITPLEVAKISLYYTIPMMLLITGMLLSFIRLDWFIRMFHGFILLIFYAFFIISLIRFF